MRRLVIPAVACAVMALAVSGPATAVATPDDRADALRLEQPRSGVTVDPALRPSGRQTVNIRLVAPAVAEVAADGANAAAQVARGNQIAVEQADLMTDLKAADPGATQVATLDTAMNSVVVEGDVTALRELATDPRIASISVVQDYSTDLSETVPYIGARAVQDSGIDGSGITVAVLDSGVDFTHAAFGGPGTVDFYTQCYGTGPTPLGQAFDAAPAGECAAYIGPDAPTVVGGYDFVGESWPETERTEDPNPIDFEGHGTHVADIIAGDAGVAPGASILAVKVCSAVSSSCNGVSLIKGMDFSLDPDGDGVTDDAVDVINMSLGSDYGLAFDDDLSFAVDNATAVGVLTVASAGNGGDKPFIAGTPAAASTALSVAQTEVPSAGLQLIVGAGGDEYAAVFQPWSAPLTTPITAPVVYGDGAGGNLDGCLPFAPGTLTGVIGLVDRGTCNFSAKIANIAAGGGVAGIIGLIAPGQPFTGSNGGDVGADAIPGYMISQDDSESIKAALPTLTIDAVNISSTVGTVVGSSSRGPSMSGQLLKPEIGAPGASVSAIAGSGSDAEAFGGTSGAAPMVAGSAALVLAAHPDYEPLQVKSLLVTTAETDILNLPTVIGGGLAPISRIGGGEVRADAAVAGTTVAYDPATGAAGFSFGTVSTGKKRLVTRTLPVTNLSGVAQTYTVTPTYRFADDEASGALRVTTSRTLRLQPGQTKNIALRVRIDPLSLPDWTLNSGPNGANGDVLTAMEYDGYVTLTSATSTLHIPWHVLPRKSGRVLDAKGDSFRNKGAVPARTEVYSLLGTSPDEPSGGRGENNPVPDLRAAGYTSIPVPAGFCTDTAASSLVLFAVNTWEEQTHANAPASISFFVDTDGDGLDDFEVFTGDLGGASPDGRNAVYAFDIEAGTASIFFLTDHDTVSGNTVLPVCAEQLGLDGTDLATEITVTPAIFDLSFTGTYTDTMDPVTITPFDPAAVPTIGGEPYGIEIAPDDRLDVVSGSGTPGTLLLVRGGSDDTTDEAFIIE